MHDPTQIALAAEIATILAWNSDSTVVLWVIHNDECRIYRDLVVEFVARQTFVPGFGELPPPTLTRKLVKEISLDNGSRLFITPMTNQATGLSITRAYVPRNVPKTHTRARDDLITSVWPTLANYGSMVRY